MFQAIETKKQAQTSAEGRYPMKLMFLNKKAYNRNLSEVPAKVKRKRLYTVCARMVENPFECKFLSFADIQAIRKHFAKQQKRLNKQAQ